MAAATVSLASPKPIHSPLNLPDPRLDLHFGGTSPTSSSFTTGTSTSTSAVPRASSSASGIATGGARGQRSGSVGTAGRSSMDSPRTDGFNSKTSSSPRPQAVGPSGVVSPSSSGSSFGSAKEKTPGSGESSFFGRSTPCRVNLEEKKGKENRATVCGRCARMIAPPHA